MGIEPTMDGTIATRVDPAHAVLDGLEADWTTLADDAAEPNSFSEYWFVAAGLRRLAGAGDVRLLTVREGAALVGVLPLSVRPRYGRVPVRHVQNTSHANSFLGVPLVRRGCETIFWTAVLGTLDAAKWAPGFLHMDGLVEDGPVHAGLGAAAAARGRSCDTVHRSVRALLASPLSAGAYYADTVRKKKRKELGRLARRLGELGTVTSATLSRASELGPWCEAFLTLEHAGWKGRGGSSLASDPATAAFFRDAISGALAQGWLEFRRIDLDGAPIAMLVNFLSPPGSFSFKTAFDEAYAKYSPGVLIQLDNLAVVERPDIDWMDSCAAPDHPMIESLWSERRSIVRVSVRLSGIRRGATFRLARALEDGSARLRNLLDAGRKGRSRDV